MADRIFAGLILAVALAYSAIAFTVIRAPFQYDPLGPESWPRILGVLASLCAVWIIVRPDMRALDVARGTWARLAILLVLLSLYAWAFQPLGFILSTFGFCLALSLMLGARLAPSLAFAAITGFVGYVVAVSLLDLNLPPGLFEALPRDGPLEFLR